MVNWKEISESFTEELAQEWISRGFSYGEVKDWIDVGLKSKDFGFANYLLQQHNDPKSFLDSLKERSKTRGKIEEISHFSTYFSSNCAIIVSKSGKDSEKFDTSLLIYDEIEAIP